MTSLSPSHAGDCPSTTSRSCHDRCNRSRLPWSRTSTTLRRSNGVWILLCALLVPNASSARIHRVLRRLDHPLDRIFGPNCTRHIRACPVLVSCPISFCAYCAPVRSLAPRLLKNRASRSRGLSHVKRRQQSSEASGPAAGQTRPAGGRLARRCRVAARRRMQGYDSSSRLAGAPRRSQYA